MLVVLLIALAALPQCQPWHEIPSVESIPRIDENLSLDKRDVESGSSDDSFQPERTTLAESLTTDDTESTTEFPSTVQYELIKSSARILAPDNQNQSNLTMSNCGDVYALTSFTLAYQNQSSTIEEQFCNFTVQKPLPSICQLNLKFNDFRFAEKEGTCKEGLAVSSYVFCGNLTGRDFDIEFSGNSLELSFFSQSLNNAFFNVTVRQVGCNEEIKNLPITAAQLESDLEIYARGSLAEAKVDGPDVRQSGGGSNSCIRNVADEEFLIQSPGYPGNYPDSVDCVTTVYPSRNNICDLELRFDEFRIEPSGTIDECATDYLEIIDDDQLNKPLKYCGVFAGVRLIPMGRQKRFVFHSDQRNSDTGYSIFVKQIPCRGGPSEPSTTLPPPVSIPPTPVSIPPTPQDPLGGRTPAPPGYGDETYFPALPGYLDPSDEPILIESLPAKPLFCSRTYPLSEDPVQITSPNFPSRYLNDESCDYFLEITGQEKICFLRLEFVIFAIGSSVGCREDFLEIFGNRICGTQTGSVYLPVSANDRLVKMTFKTDGSGRGNGFEIGISQVPCQQSGPDGTIIVGGGPGGRQPIGGQGYYPGNNYIGENIRDTYGSPTIPTYGKPIEEEDGFIKPTFATLPAPNSYGSPNPQSTLPLREEQDILVSVAQPFPDPQILEEVSVVESGLPIPPRPSYNSPSKENSIFYGSTQTSSFIGNSPSETEFKPSVPIISNTDFNLQNQAISSFKNPTSQILVVEDLDSYGAPLGPVISSSGQPEIISARPGFFKPLSFGQPGSSFNDDELLISSHLPTETFDVPLVNSYGAPITHSNNNQGPNLASLPISPPNLDYGVPSDPIYPPVDNYGSPNVPSLPINPPRDVIRTPSVATFPSDSYGAPEAPVLISNPPSDSYGVPAAPVLPPNSPSTGYGAPLAPVLPSKPLYYPQNPNRPNYRPQGKFPNFLAPIAGLLDAKRRAIANLFGGFRKSRFLSPGTRPNYNKPPSFELPFIGGKTRSKRPRTRPSYLPTSDYGAPQFSPKPSYERPPRTASSSFNGDPRSDTTERSEEQDIEVFRCGNSYVVPETFAEEFIFKSPNYPDNYPDGFNCSLNIFPRKDACALSLVMEDFIVEESTFCHYDYLAIGSRDDPNKKRICGQQSYRILEIVTPDSIFEPWVLEFVSDSIGHQRGFSIRGSQISCSELDLRPLEYFDPYKCGNNDLSGDPDQLDKDEQLYAC